MALKPVKKKDPEVLNAAEAKVIENHAEEVTNSGSGVSSEILNKALALVSDTFNLRGKGYSVAKFDTKKCAVTLLNGNFIISVEICNPYEHGIYEGGIVS